MFWRNIDKNLLRNILYLLAVIFIGYFMFNINSVAQEITQKEITEDKNIDSIFEFEPFQDPIKEYKTYGEYIWEICLSLMQIIFLVMFMLMLYKNE